MWSITLHVASARFPAALAAVAAFVILAVAGCGGDAATVEIEPPQGDEADLVLIDESHDNFHTLGTTYRSLGRVLQENFYQAERLTQGFTSGALEEAEVLIVSNALHPSNREEWVLPNPSAFTRQEVQVVKEWVEGGGGLLLVADHMPFPGAASELAAAFGVTFSNGFAFDSAQISFPENCLEQDEIHIFRRSDGTLPDHPITNPPNGARIDSIATFTGSAFDPDGVMEPLMQFNEKSVSIETTRSWDFRRDVEVVDVPGWLQGGALEVGDGRVVFLGEAAMFTNKQCLGDYQGWLNPAADQNRQFFINIIRWLTHSL